MGPNARRALLTKAASALEAKADQFVDAMMGEIGSTEGWARFNLMLAAGMVREAASLTTQIQGEVIPSDKPGCLAMAVRLANDTEYGLSASVFTKDIARGLRVARRIQSGICHVNGPTVHDEAQMPFGGVKASGYGRFGGRAGIDAFTELRWITVETLPGHFPI